MYLSSLPNFMHDISCNIHHSSWNMLHHSLCDLNYHLWIIQHANFLIYHASHSIKYDMSDGSGNKQRITCIIFWRSHLTFLSILIKITRYYLQMGKFLGDTSGSKITDMIDDLSKLLLSKSIIGEEFSIDTKNIKVF